MLIGLESESEMSLRTTINGRVPGSGHGPTRCPAARRPLTRSRGPAQAASEPDLGVSFKFTVKSRLKFNFKLKLEHASCHVGYQTDY